MSPAAKRPTHGKRTPAREAIIIGVLQKGGTRRAACAAAGISTDSLERWQKRDAAFAALVEKAELACAVESVERIRAAGQGGALLEETVTTTTKRDGTTVVVERRRYSAAEWTADAWYLERKWPEDWGRRDRVALEDARRAAEEAAAELGVPVEEVYREAGITSIRRVG